MKELRPAATVILTRPAATPSGFQVACLQRDPRLPFLGGFWVFPGGACEPAEAAADAAIRETFEETGILLIGGAERLDPARLDNARERLVTEGWDLPRLLRHLELDGPRLSLVPCGRWRTPPFGPRRFDTAFFAGQAPPGARLHAPPGESIAAAWLDPRELLARWRRDEARLAPPTRFALEALAGLERDPASPGWLGWLAAAVRARDVPGHEFGGPIDFHPGIGLVLVRTPTLPPATHTNCYVVGDGSELVVLDPASPYPEEQAQLDALLDRLAAEGRRVRELILTHHHHDHSSGATHLARRLGVPIAAHARTREILAGRVQVTRDIADGELIELPADLPGSRPRRLRAHLTEGHADGHLIFHEEVTGCVITGDLVAGVGTILIDPPEGDMSVYLDSLRAMRALEPTLLLPAHGPSMGDPRGVIDHYLNHRLQREDKVLAAVAAGPGDVATLVPRAYADKPPAVFPLAERAALAHLLKLERDGRVQREGSTWSLAASA